MSARDRSAVRRGVLLAFIVAALLLGGCGLPGPHPPTPAPGDTLHLPLAARSFAATVDCRMSLAAIRDPFDGDEPSEYGTRVVAVRLLATALADGPACADATVTLVLEDGTAITGRSPATDARTGQSAVSLDGAEFRLVFVIYADAHPVSLAVAFPGTPVASDDD